VIDALTAPYGVLLLRWCLGTMFIAHALYKWLVDTLPRAVAFFKSIHLPGWFAYMTIATELSGGTCLILGIYPRYVALLLMPTMIGTIVKVHGKNGWSFANKGGGWEYPAFWTATLFAVFLLGDGPLTLLASPPLSELLLGKR
jgi:putative oxidoreductase